MDEHTRKRIIAFTSQSVKQYGIRAVRMDIIARHTNVSKRTIYQVFATKDNLINTCLEAYSGRMQNWFQLIAYNNPDPLACLWETCKAYIENLYKGECIFWLDIYRHYQGIYLAINQIWWDELKKSIAACQSTHRIQASLDTDIFLRSFTELLYKASSINPRVLFSDKELRNSMFEMSGMWLLALQTMIYTYAFSHHPFLNL